MSVGNAVAKNTAVQFGARGLGTILGVVAIGAMTRHLGPEGYGAYTTITSFLQVFGVLVDFGLTIVCLQMLAEPNADEGKILGNAVGLRLAIAVVFLGSAPLIALLFPYSRDIHIGIAFTTLSFLSIAIHQIIITLFQKRLTMKAAAVSELVGRCVLVGLVFAALALNAGLMGMLAATTLANIIQLLVAGIAAQRLVPFKIRFDQQVWRSLLTRSWPIGLSIAFNLIYLRADAVLLSIWRPQAELGLYGAAYRVIDVLTVLPFLFMGIVLPQMVLAWDSGNRQRFAHIMQRAQDALFLLILPIVAGGLIVGQPLMALVAGDAFRMSGQYLALLLFGVMMIFWGTVWSHGVVALRLQKRMLPLYAADAALALLLYWLLIPRYGAWAAAGVTVLSEAGIAIAAALVVSHQAGTRFAPGPLLRTLLATGTMAGSLLLLNHFLPNPHILLQLLVGSAVYLAGIVLFRAISPQDLKRILSPFTRRRTLLS